MKLKIDYTLCILIKMIFLVDGISSIYIIKENEVEQFLELYGQRQKFTPNFCVEVMKSVGKETYLN